MRMASRRSGGYTVIELLLVMIIIGVLAGITYARMAPTLERARVRGAASILAGDLQYAQVLAARQRLPVVVAVNSGALTYQIADRAGTVYRTRDLGMPGEFDLSEVSATPASLEVFPNGVAAQSATYTLGAGTHRQLVTFSRAGQIRVNTVP
jgi:prepilin-type N-terminal cleavage/methylation domain-containing protein